MGGADGDWIRRVYSEEFHTVFGGIPHRIRRNSTPYSEEFHTKKLGVVLIYPPNNDILDNDAEKRRFYMGKKPQNEIVKKSNALIRSSWSVASIWEPRLVALVASKIRVEDEDFKTYMIPISELLEGTGQKRGGRLYEEIEQAVEKLFKMPIKIREPNGKLIICGIFSMCAIIPGEGLIEVRFDSVLKPHYLQLKERFTQYCLEEFMKLPSIYSQRIFEILTSWKNLLDGEITISMDELHSQLDTPASYRKDFKAFRLFVLEQSYKDITKNPNSSLDYEWQPVKQGRKVLAVRFIFDRGRIEKERQAKEKEAQRLQSKRNNELYIAAHRCSRNMVIVPVAEQESEQRKQKREICDMCQSQQMLQSLFPLECRRYKRVEIVD